MTISVSLDRDLEVRVKKFASGIGVTVEQLVERALVYALRSRYPDNSLPGNQPGIDNELPRPPFEGTIDNELPEGEIPVDLDPDLNPNPDANRNPNLNRNAPRPDQELPDTPEPKPAA